MCLLCKSVDASKVEAFGGRLLEVINHGALSLMLSIGHRTGLFDTMAAMPASSAAEIAQAAGLDARYVREWLGAMTTGRIVEHDAFLGTYHLPAEHAAMLTRRATPNNLGVAMQFISVLGGVEDRVVECFREGGGVPYAEYQRFHEVMAEESGQTVGAALFEHILPLVPGLVERLDRGIEVLDVGCGRGRTLHQLARRFPKSRFVGVDFCHEAISWARGEAEEDALENVTFEVRDAAQLGFTEAFDLIATFDAIHDQARPDLVLAGIQRALRAGGVYLMQDIDSSSSHAGDLKHPLGPMLYTISTMHCMTVSLALGGMGLGTMWGEQTARRMLAEAGFFDLEVRRLPHDIQNAYYISRKDALAPDSGA